MLFSRKLFATLLAAVVVSAEKREVISGAVRFCDMDHNAGDCAQGSIMTDECYDIKDGLFGQNLGYFNDKVHFFTPLNDNYFCLVWQNWGCSGLIAQVDYPGSENLGALAGITSAFKCHTYTI